MFLRNPVSIYVAYFCASSVFNRELLQLVHSSEFRLGLMFISTILKMEMKKKYDATWTIDNLSFLLSGDLVPSSLCVREENICCLIKALPPHCGWVSGVSCILSDKVPINRVRRCDISTILVVDCSTTGY